MCAFNANRCRFFFKIANNHPKHTLTYPKHQQTAVCLAIINIFIHIFMNICTTFVSGYGEIAPVCPKPINNKLQRQLS